MTHKSCTKTVLFSLMFLVSSSVFAQNPPSSGSTSQFEDIKANVRRLLASEQVREQAWAAYYIGKFRWTEFIPELEKLLTRENEASVEYLHRATLDALIQLNTNVNAELLLPQFSRFPDQVIILLAVNPRGNEQAFLSLLREERSEEIWLSLCNLLVKSKSKGLASRLIRELKITASVGVVDGSGGVGGGSYSSGCGDGWRMLPAGFPPLVSYHLTKVEKIGATVFTVGPHPTYYERRERLIDTNGIGVGGCTSYGNRNAYRVEYLAALLNVTEAQLGFSATPSFTITWKGLLPYQREMRNLKLKVRQSYDQLLEKLISADLLTASDAKILSPHVEYKIDDQRKDKSIALPQY